jgi:hypothetical protein
MEFKVLKSVGISEMDLGEKTIVTKKTFLMPSSETETFSQFVAIQEI